MSATTSNDSPGAVQSAPKPTLPAHVPTSLVHDIDRYMGPNNFDDPFSVTADVYDVLPPVFYTTRSYPGLYSGAWVVTHYEDIREIYQNGNLYSTQGAAGFQSLVGETFRMIPLAVDMPEHRSYRALLNSWFSPKAVDALEPKIREAINSLIDGFVDKGQCDISYDFGRIFPVRVFLNLMGFPLEKMDEFLSWEYALLHSYGDLERVRWGIGSAINYLRGFAEQVKKAPDGNLASRIVHGQVDGRPLTDDEIIGTLTFLWIGGLDTVAATTSLMFRRLALDPALQQRLRDEPDRVPDAIEEFLRVQPLVNSTRLVKEDHQIRGVTIKKGEHVMCFNVAGNFDPAEFDSSREFKVDRVPNRHFTFAAGPHNCLGAHLARRELRIALEDILRRIPSFRLRTDADRMAHPGLIAVPRLPITWW
jgi:cytochrome P450